MRKGWLRRRRCAGKMALALATVSRGCFGLQLIGMLDSPYVRRVAVALIAANIGFEHKPISLFRHVDAFARINPLLKAPTLVTDEGIVLIDSTLILDHLAMAYPALAELTPSAPADRLRALRATGLALVVMEKAVQRHYERALRPEEKLHQPWVDRIMDQLCGGLLALDSELPKAGWIAGELGLADIAAACAYSFTVGMISDVIDVAPYPNLGAFAARAEALPAFRAAPARDGVTAPVAVEG